MSHVPNGVSMDPNGVMHCSNGQTMDDETDNSEIMIMIMIMIQ